jgi:hypothetical protein
MVSKQARKVHPQGRPDKGKVKPAAVIGVDCIHTAKGFKKIITVYLSADQLHQLALPAINQVDADDGYIRILAGQAGGFNV